MNFTWIVLNDEHFVSLLQVQLPLTVQKSTKIKKNNTASFIPYSSSIKWIKKKNDGVLVFVIAKACYEN